MIFFIILSDALCQNPMMIKENMLFVTANSFRYALLVFLQFQSRPVHSSAPIQ